MDSFVYTISCDMIGVDKTRERIGTILLFARFFAAILWCQGKGRTEFKISRETSIFLYHCMANIIFNRHIISILAPRYVLHVHVLCSQCFVIQILSVSSEVSKRRLVGGSDRWNDISTSISSAISTWMLNEISSIRSNSTWISGNTLRPTLAADCLFAWFEGHLLAFFTQGQSFFEIELIFCRSQGP